MCGCVGKRMRVDSGGGRSPVGSRKDARKVTMGRREKK